MTLTYFTARSNLATWLFDRKKWKLLIFQNYCSLWLLTDWDNEDMWVLKVKVISWPWTKVIYIQNLKLAFLTNHWVSQNQILFGASLGRGNESLYKWSRSHDQDGRHAQKCSKPWKNLLLQNHWANCLETWHVASEYVVLQNLYKSWPLVDLDLFYSKVNQGSLMLFYRKKWKLLIFQNYCSLWLLTAWDNEDMWVLKVKVISWPWPKVIYIQNLKLAFLRNHWANQSQILYVSFQVQGNENLSIWCWSYDQDGCHAHIW